MALSSLVIITAFSGYPPGLGKMLRNCLLLTMKELFIGGNLTRRTQLPMLFGKRSMIIKKLTTERLKTRRPGTLQLWKERNLRQLKTLLCTGPRMVWSLCSWMTTTVTACLHWVWVMGCNTGHSTSYSKPNVFGVNKLYDPGCRGPSPSYVWVWAQHQLWSCKPVWSRFPLWSRVQSPQTWSRTNSSFSSEVASGVALRTINSSKMQ